MKSDHDACSVGQHGGGAIPRVYYYRMDGGKNASFAVVFGEWPHRSLTHRGWTSERLRCTRVATRDEIEWLSNCNRFQAMRYETLEALLDDESGFCDPNQLARLRVNLEPAESVWQLFQNKSHQQ